jgi:hypothetical protein
MRTKLLLCWPVPKGYLDGSTFSISSQVARAWNTYLPDVSVRIEPILTNGIEDCLTVKSGGPRILSQHDFIEEASPNTDSLRGAMTETTLEKRNSNARIFMILFVRSIFAWSECQ